MKARSGGAILAAFVALFALFYASSDFALTAFRRLGPSALLDAHPASEPSPFTNPALAVKESEASLPLGVGSLKLGDLVRMLNTMDSSLEVKAFYASFMSKPSLRSALKRFAEDHDGKALQRSLVGDREFAALFDLYSRSDRFQFRLAMLSQPPQGSKPKEARAPERARSPSPIPFRAEPAAEIGHPAAGSASEVARAEGGAALRTGIGYDGEPQPGIAGVDELPPMIAMGQTQGAGGESAATPKLGVQLAASSDAPTSVATRANVANTVKIIASPAAASNSAYGGGSSGSGGSCWPPGHCKRDGGDGGEGRD